MQLVGCDFSSTPTRRKPILLAIGSAAGGRVQLTRLEKLESLAAFADWLRAPHAWIAGFDFPFGLPRELVEHLGWPTGWRDCMRHYASLTRPQIRETFAAYCASRPAGAKVAHRRFDRLAGCSG